MALATASPRRKRGVFAHRRGIAVGGLGIALLATGAAFLGTTGSTTPSISVPPGTPSAGVADITPLSGSVTRTNGGASLQTGVALAKIVMAKSASHNFRLQVAWTNAQATAQVIGNPSTQLSIGLYHPIHTGNCNSGNGSTTDAPLVNIIDTDSATYCAALDQGATGSNSVSSTGKLIMINSGPIAGFLIPAVDGSGAISACTTSGVDTGSWCQPASVTDSNQRALFLVASITKPGTIPQGLQSSLTNLTFYEQAQRIS